MTTDDIGIEFKVLDNLAVIEVKKNKAYEICLERCAFEIVHKEAMRGLAEDRIEDIILI
jgi:hypothetical protein